MMLLVLQLVLTFSWAVPDLDRASQPPLQEPAQKAIYNHSQRTCTVTAAPPMRSRSSHAGVLVQPVAVLGE
jgi:hypothetical protein